MIFEYIDHLAWSFAAEALRHVSPGFQAPSLVDRRKNSNQFHQRTGEHNRKKERQWYIIQLPERVMCFVIVMKGAL